MQHKLVEALSFSVCVYLVVAWLVALYVRTCKTSNGSGREEKKKKKVSKVKTTVFFYSTRPPRPTLCFFSTALEERILA